MNNHKTTESIFVKDAGPRSGPTIVFLHGLGVSGWMWDEQVEALSSQYRCIVVDLPGSGESYQHEWCSFGDTADHLACVIRQRTDNGKAHLVGLSLGGYTTLHALARHPGLIESAIVSGVTTKPFSNQWMWHHITRASTGLARWDTTNAMMARAMQLPDEAAELYRRDSKRLTKLTVKRVYDEVLNFSLPAELRGLQTPVLAVAGERELATTKQGLSAFRPVLINSVTALVPNAYHTWNAQYPALFTEMIRAWVEKKPLPTALKLTDMN